MKITKSHGKKAFVALQQLKDAGVPDYVTASEAFNLSNGKCGVPYAHPLRNVEFRLIDVAVKIVQGQK